VIEERELTENTSRSTYRHGYGEGIIGAISVGAFFVLLGLVFLINNGLWGAITSFFNDFTNLPVSGTSVFLPAPADPAAHALVYLAAAQLALGLGILQILILGLRFIFHSHARRWAQTIGSLVFWFGTSYLISIFLNDTTTVHLWFTFWAALLILGGVSLLIRALALLSWRQMNPRQTP
jgi:hypothetical protein